MKTIRINNPFDISIDNTDIPKVGIGEALLKIKCVGICGSDAATYKGTQPFSTYPRIPGHEFGAVIEEIGENEFGFKKGMSVTAVPYFNCGKCYSCQKGRINCCEDNQTMGVQRDGAFCEYITMPIERLIDSKDIDEEILALVEPYCISYHAVKHAKINTGDNVLVVGAGPIGTFAAIAAQKRGATVVLYDLLEKRLGLAKKMGIKYTACEDNLDRVTKALGIKNGYDICIEAVGIAPTFLKCVDMACFGGQIVLIGNGKTEVQFNHSVLLKKELTIYGSRNALRSDFEEVTAMIADGRLKLDKIITHKFSLEDAKEAFDLLANNDGSASKVILKL